MAEHIIARLMNTEDAVVQWLFINDATPSESQLGTLQDLAECAKNRPVTLLLPASAVLLLGMDLPVKNSSQIKKALPFALEDFLADDVETYHLVWHRHSKGTVYVAAISHEKMQACLLLCQEAGIEIDSVYPEALCLPYQDPGCSIVIDEHNAIFRSGQWLGGGIDVAVLPAIVDKMLEENPQLQSLQVWCTGSMPQWLSELSIRKEEYPLDSTILLMHRGAAQLGEHFDLLTGPYSREKSAIRQWQHWLPALGIMLLAALIQSGVWLYGYWQQKSELALLETKTLSLFKQTFPEIKRIVNIKAQADQQLTELQKSGANNGSRFMRLLFQSGEVINANPGFQLRQLDFVNDSLQLQLAAPGISQVEQFKQQLESSNQLSVTVQSAEAGQHGVEAHLEIREK